MNKEYSILLQKDGVETSAKDIQDDFGFVCTSIVEGRIEAKELEKNSWWEEDGEEVFIPSNMKLMGLDLEIGLVYVGTPNTYHQKLDALIGYLTSELGEFGLMTFSQFHNRGFRYCFFKSFDENTLFKGTTEECYECKLTLRSEDPRTRVSPSTDGNGKISLNVEAKKDEISNT